MTERYAGDNTEVFEVWRWYKRALLATRCPAYRRAIGRTADVLERRGRVPSGPRVLSAGRADLLAYFDDPFEVDGNSLYHLAWNAKRPRCLHPPQRDQPEARRRPQRRPMNERPMSTAVMPPDAVILNPAHTYRARAPQRWPAAGARTPTCWPISTTSSASARRTARRNTCSTLPYRPWVAGGKYILGPDQQWLAPSITDYPPAEGNCCRPRSGCGSLAGDVRTLPSRQGKPTVVIAKAGADNYGHTLTEILPRLVNLCALPIARRAPAAAGQSMDPLHVHDPRPGASAIGASSAEPVFVPEQEITAAEGLGVRRPRLRNTTSVNRPPCSRFATWCGAALAITPVAATAPLHRAPAPRAAQPGQRGRGARKLLEASRLRDGPPGNHGVRRPGPAVQPGEPHRGHARRRPHQHPVCARIGCRVDDDRSRARRLFFLGPGRTWPASRSPGSSRGRSLSIHTTSR